MNAQKHTRISSAGAARRGAALLTVLLTILFSVSAQPQNNVGLIAPLGQNVVTIDTEANFHTAKRLAPQSGLVRTTIYIPKGVRIILTQNAAAQGTLARPYLDYWIDGELVCGTPAGDGLSTYWDDTGLGVQASTNYLWGSGGVTLSNNVAGLSLGGAPGLFIAGQSGTQYFINLSYVRCPNTNLALGQPMLFFANNGTYYNVMADELVNRAYDIFVANGTTGKGRFVARLWEVYGQAWEFNANQSAGSYYFYFDTLQSPQNTIPIGQVDFHMFDMVDGIHCKGNFLNLDTNRFGASPIAGNGTGVLEVQRIVKTGNTTNCAVYAQNFTLLNSHVEAGTNIPIVVIGANFRVQNSIIESTSSTATNSIMSAAAQTMISWGSFTNKPKHQNVTVNGSMLGY